MHRSLAVALCALGCHATPSLNGASLACEAHADCGAELRCYRGICIRNSVPVIDMLGARVVAVGAEIVVEAVGHDDEGDALTFTWRQLSGPTLLAAPRTGAALAVTPAEAGAYLFAVRVADRFAEGAEVFLTLLARATAPAGTPVYVDDGATEPAGCGEVTRPCPTLEAGLAARDVATAPVFVAATAGTETYRHCLTLGDGQSVWGSFEPGTWRYDPVLRGRTEIACEAPRREERWPAGLGAGHAVSGSAAAGDLTLSATVVDSASFDYTATLFVDGGTAHVVDLDVTMPLCDGCWTAGVWSEAAAPLSGTSAATRMPRRRAWVSPWLSRAAAPLRPRSPVGAHRPPESASAARCSSAAPTDRSRRFTSASVGSARSPSMRLPAADSRWAGCRPPARSSRPAIAAART